MNSLQKYIIETIYFLPGILIGFTAHEFSHAFMAYKLGDKTPKFQGRLTLNPLSHIDPIGLISMVVAGFGWAKPVEVNMRAFKRPYSDDLKVSIAGPLANLAVSLFGVLLLIIIYNTGIENITFVNYIVTFIYYTIYINCLLFVFNLMPLPGLDGFHILRDLMPEAVNKIYYKAYKMQMMILIAFVLPINGYSLADIFVGIPFKSLYHLLMKTLNI